jgi:triosephosphate isomerase
MRKPLIAGNWKMHLDRTGAVALAAEIARAVRDGHLDPQRVELAVCPPLVYLDAVAQVLRDAPVALGAQNAFYEPQGAYTGEVSAAMLVDLGCRYVILGHSERRHILGETDQQVCKKVHAALAAGLTPIVCVGELLSQRESGQTADVIRHQFQHSLAGLTAEQMGRVVIAYEPVWAIGTGRVATPQQAQEVHAELRKLLETQYNAATAAVVRIQYGGSVKPDNAAELLRQPDVDGALVGGASLKAKDFLAIAAAAV